MLLPRVITACVLLLILLPIVYFGWWPGYLILSTVFLGAAIWECARLCEADRVSTLVLPILVCAIYLLMLFGAFSPSPFWVLFSCVLIWIVRLAPTLIFGLPQQRSSSAKLNGAVYGLTILGAFSAMGLIFAQSPLMLLSVLSIVWVADIGAYFAGKSFGRHKMAPSISPGKTWEGAIGGWILTLILGVASVAWLNPANIFAARVGLAWGWFPLLIIITLIVAASIAGDLFESSLKRRAGVKDSSQLLPGHGGVLDRIDALIPVLPLAALVILHV